jgi:hypothetical protein
VALARLLDCRLVMLDERLIRGVARLDIADRPREDGGPKAARTAG